MKTNSQEYLKLNIELILVLYPCDIIVEVS